jgi:hyperosmotically inducible periplasmic protein
MKYFGIALIGSLAAACAANTAPPAASVGQASNSPSTGPDFTPVASDGTASAAGDPHPTVKNPAVQTAPGGSAADAPGPPQSNVAAMPAQNPSPSEPDNSRMNARDRNGSTLTPMDQGSGEQDRRMTQQIRQAVVKDGSLSFTAKNVKIITINGKVTLRGPVKTDAESVAIESAAKKVAGAGQVDNFLEVKN